MTHRSIYPDKVLFPVKRSPHHRVISKAVSLVVSRMKPLARCICGDLNCHKWQSK